VCYTDKMTVVDIKMQIDVGVDDDELYARIKICACGVCERAFV